MKKLIYDKILKTKTFEISIFSTSGFSIVERTLTTEMIIAKEKLLKKFLKKVRIKSMANYACSICRCVIMVQSRGFNSKILKYIMMKFPGCINS